MRIIVTAAAAALLAGGAAAQLTAPVQSALGGAGRTAGAATGGVSDTIGSVSDTARDTAVPATRSAGTVKVRAGASTRVDRGTRCYYDDGYYDPVYRDGRYYCERSGTSAGVAAGAKVGK